MAYVEIRKNGKLIARRPVEDRKARTGLRVRIGSAGQVHVAVGRPEALGEYEVQVFEGQPPEVRQDGAPAVSAPATGPGTMQDLGFSGPDAGRRPDLPEALPQIENYRVIAPLGRGGMGTVWRAEQLSTHREVALKLMTAHRVMSEKAQARFQREVELTARLDHPNIARIYESGLHRGVHYYAMELIEGTALDQYVKSNGLARVQVLGLMKTVCQAVLFAHLHAVIHRDLKPSNILVTPDGQPHVLDFGLAKALLEEDEDLAISVEGQIAGTPAYMSPEQATGRRGEIDTRTDVFSLGVILYELLLGQSPHDLSGSMIEVLSQIAAGKIREPRQIDKSMDRELQAILLTALARKPENRYASAGALGKDLSNYLAGEPLDAPVPTTLYFLRKKARKYRVHVAVALIVAAGLLLAYTKVVAHRARLHAAQEALAAQMGKAELAEQKARWAQLELVILGDNEAEARAALRMLQDEYLSAQSQISELRQMIDQLKAKDGDIPPPFAGFTFNYPVNIGLPVNTKDMDEYAVLSPDGLELYFHSNGREGPGSGDIWLATRASSRDPWGSPVSHGLRINRPDSRDWPTGMSSDGLELYLMDGHPQDAGRAERRPEGHGKTDLWVSMRTAARAAWGYPANLGPRINGPDNDCDACISSDGLTLYFSSDRGDKRDNWDIWMATRAAKQDPWEPPVNLGPPINTPQIERRPHICANDLVLLFVSDRSGGLGGSDLYVSRRTTANDPWPEPINMGSMINRKSREESPFLSFDRSTILFTSSRSGGWGQRDIWLTTIIPVIDINRDKAVDVNDVARLIQCWGTGEAVADIAPLPFGDGTVDKLDLATLMRHWDRKAGSSGDPPPAAVDLDGSRTIDLDDLLILVKFWGLNEPSADIAPASSRDGVVDGADLKLLLQYWGRQLPPDPGAAAARP
jgi:hypothetical protein